MKVEYKFTAAEVDAILARHIEGFGVNVPKFKERCLTIREDEDFDGTVATLSWGGVKINDIDIPDGG